MSERPIDIWRKKLEFLQTEEATASDAEQKFKIQQEILKAKQRIAELQHAAELDLSDSELDDVRDVSTDAPVRAGSSDSGGEAPMSPNQSLQEDLRDMTQRGQVVAVVGSGVSRATTASAPLWRELIESGVKQCQTLGAADAWCRAVAGQLELDSEPEMLLSAAELVHSKLREQGGGELARWLRETFQDLQPTDTSIIQTLAALDIPLLTTNYDDLIEKVTSLRHVSWTDGRTVTRVVRGDDRRVLHLHGFWEDPDSVVLGIRSYEAVKNNEHTQAVMKALGMTKSFLFVGCGEEGLGDPNFGNFLTWLEAIETGSGVEHRHYRLVRQQDAFAPQGRLFPLVYGGQFGDLPKFLEDLRPAPLAAGDPQQPEPTPARVLTPVSPAVDEYLRWLAEETSRLSMLGMGRSLAVELPIAEAYVPLRTTLARSLEQQKTMRSGKDHGEFSEEVDVGDVFHKAAALGERGVILLGEPGSGKTTGARQLAWRLASRQCLPQDLGLPANLTPVLLRFRKVSQDVLDSSNGLRSFLEAETFRQHAPDDLQSPGRDLWNIDGGLLWILDGLDEVIEPAARQQVSGWVRDAIAQRVQDWFLVTCRFQGYFREGVPLGPRFVEFHVRPLDDRQVEHFVRDWFAAAYRKLPGPRAQARAQADSDELLDILARPTHQLGHIRELCTNPLLLTILCIVFHEERKLPTGRAELYAHCVRVLLEHWRRDLYKSDLPTTVTPYDAEAAQAALARLAWWMHQQQDRTAAPLAELAAEVEKGLAQVSPSSGLGRDGHGFLERMREETGILAMTGDAEGSCGFLHLSFQEYLAAEYAAHEGLAKQLATQAAESWWREVALLALRHSRPFCEGFFREMLRAGIAEKHPDLAERCLTEALYFVPAPFVEVLEKPRSQKRVAAVLRLLRDRAEQVPELEEICRRLAASQDPETQGFAREILIRRGVAVKAKPEEAGVFVDKKSGVTLVEIPAGEFQMGSDKGDDDERPVHTVRITRDFQLGKYPVTNAQYRRFLEAQEAADESTQKPEYWDDRRFNQPEQPVVGVSWDEAQAFCQWAGGRLPTEAEWEYACRAGTTTEYSFGDDEEALKEHGWFADNSNQTQPVGAKKPNPWGLFDMHGNVWEWCADWFGPGYYAKSPADDPVGPPEGSLRVFRGGSWDFSARRCRSAFRDGRTPALRNDLLGFRLALVPSSQETAGAEPET